MGDQGTSSQMVRCMHCFGLYSEEVYICPHCGHEEGSGKRKSFYLQCGTTLHQGRYMIGEAVRNGGFGILYRAWDLNLEKLIAIKEYYPIDIVKRAPGGIKVTLNAENEYYQQEYQSGIRDFISEARIMMKFTDTESVCNTYTYFEENGTAYIVMEFIDGISLREYTKRTGYQNISEEDFTDIMHKVLDGLTVIHEADVIHRDIAPDNILVKEDGSIKIIDFGASCIKGKKREKDEVIFKPGFAPPEQYTGYGEIGPWMDIYATGATFYYMLTGKVPTESTEREKEDHLAPPSELNPNVPKDVNAAVMGALAPKIENRYQTAEEVKNRMDGKKVHTPHEKEVRKKMGHIFGWGLLIALVLFLAAKAVIFFRDNIAGTSDKLVVWLAVSEDATATEQEVARYRAVFDKYSQIYPDVKIEIVQVPEDKLSEQFMRAAKKNKPDLIELYNVTEEVKEELVYLSFMRESAPLNKSALKATELVKFKGYPLSRAVSMKFTAGEEGEWECRASESIEIFLKGEEYRSYSSDSSAYETIKECLGDQFEIVEKEEETVYYTDFFGIYKQSTLSEEAQRLLVFLAGDVAQRILHLQNESDMLPITENVLNEYINQNPMLEYLRESISGYTIVSCPGTNSLYRSKHIFIESMQIMPTMETMTETEAVKVLEDMGLVARVRYEYSETVAEGVVISQYPEAGKKVFSNESIRVTVSSGKRVVNSDEPTEKPVKATKKPTQTPTPKPTNTPTPKPKATNTPTPEPTNTPTPTSVPTFRDVSKLDVGSVVTMGRYEQDNDSSTKSEPIEWVILAKENGKVLLISKYVLDVKPYAPEGGNCYWEDSEIRSWLNGSFYKSAFNSAEVEKILTSSLDNKYNETSGTYGGSGTRDRLFLLSLDEANQYLSTYAKCKATKFATQKAETCTEYWLRSPGSNSNNAATVSETGRTYSSGRNISMEIFGVRPAMWISE